MADEKIIKVLEDTGKELLRYEGHTVARQLDAVKHLNIPERNMIVEKQSGKNFNERPLYQALKLRLRADQKRDNKDRTQNNYFNIFQFLSLQQYLC